MQPAKAVACIPKKSINYSERQGWHGFVSSLLAIGDVLFQYEHAM